VLEARELYAAKCREMAAPVTGQAFPGYFGLLVGWNGGVNVEDELVRGVEKLVCATNARDQ
jgi:hypothetical protein